MASQSTSRVHAWVEEIIRVLFEPDDRRISSEIQRLNTLNIEIKKQNLFGFIHGGKRFIDPRYKDQEKVLAKFPLPTLALSLIPQLRQFDLDRERIERDKRKIQQALVPLISDCQSLEELRDVLPECVVSLIPILRAKPRTREDNIAHIRDDPFLMHNYRKALPLMEAYSVANLLF